jgi:polyhydroxybutyrate depolymerase
MKQGFFLWRHWAAVIVVAAAVIMLELVQLAGKSEAVAATSRPGAIVVQGRQRTFVRVDPEGPSARSSPLPVVVVLHGGGGNGSRVIKQSGLADQVDRFGMLALFPDAGKQQWNDGRETTRSSSDDVMFLRNLIAEAVRSWGGDPSRVFIVGASSGGMMALRMGCDASNVITAIGIVVANMPKDLANRCRPGRAIPIIMFNGTEDPIMPWGGGPVASSPILGGAGGLVLSTLDTFDLWSSIDGCSASQITELKSRIKSHSAIGCKSGGQVLLYEIDGGGHGWPGGNVPQSAIARQIVGYISKDISATSLLIQFFKQYGL